jgi:putative tricarboxylic transport membrane protein
LVLSNPPALAGGGLVPIIILLVILGAYGVANDVRDVILAFAFGAIGCLMKKYDYSRVTLTIGFVLGDYVERYFLLSLSTLGPKFLLVSPIASGLLLLTLFGLLGRSVKSLSRRFFKGFREEEE